MSAEHTAECPACTQRIRYSEEYAGTPIECPNCRTQVVLPSIEPEFAAEEVFAECEEPVAAPPGGGLQFQSSRAESAEPEPAAAGTRRNEMHHSFNRDKFLLRQKHLALSEKYLVWDEHGGEIMFVERPSHYAMGCLALIAGMSTFALCAWLVSLVVRAFQGNDTLFIGALVIGGLLTFVAAIAVVILITPKRHLNFYRDSAKRQLLLEVKQEQKVTFLVANFTVRDPHGNFLGTLRKNYLYDFFRKQWQAVDHNGEVLFRAKEDSFLKAFLRRFLGPLFGILRTNFVYTDASHVRQIGAFNRTFTLLDRYVLDMTPDPRQQYDRRLCLAMGVMLDTGEKR